jgi:hypothetical protein
MTAEELYWFLRSAGALLAIDASVLSQSIRLLASKVATVAENYNGDQQVALAAVRTYLAKLEAGSDEQSDASES